MGKMRPLCAASAQGNSLTRQTAKASEKYVRGLDMLLRDPEVWLKSLKK